MSDELSCVDLLKQQDELIEEAASALPLKSNKCTCTRKRQQIYSCLTCSDEYKTPVGVCYSCHINCHTTHNLIALDVKTFTCDCWRYSCTLRAPSATETVANSYNHNFIGKYCHCDSVYAPEDTMYQCLLCEDWFHDTCLDQPAIDTSEEYICCNCVSEYDILKRYAGNPHFKFKSNPLITLKDCPLDQQGILEKTDLFLLKGWELCKCIKCIPLLPKQLLDSEEIHQEELDPKANMNLYELGIQELLKVDRSKALEGIYAYDSMKKSLYQNLLIPCMERGETVTLDLIMKWIETIKENSA